MTDGSELRPAGSRGRFLLLVLIFAVLSWLVSGYRFYSSNHALQIPLLHLVIDPSLYPGDPFAETLHLYATYFWHLTAFLSRGVPLESLMIALFVLERILFVFAAAVLARTFYPESQEAPAASMALAAVCPNPLLGGGTLTTSYLEQTAFAVPFLILAAAAFYRQRALLCALLTAAGFTLNPMYGTCLATYFLAVFLSDHNWRKEWRRWLGGAAVCLLLSVPALGFILASLGRPAPDGAAWMEAARFRFPHHLFPGTWGWKPFLAFGILSGACLTVSRQNRAAAPRYAHFLAAWTVTAALWLGFAFLAAYVFASPAMLVTHPARGTDLWHACAAVAVISSLADRYGKSRFTSERIPLLGAMLLCLLFWIEPIRTEVMFVMLLLLGAYPAVAPFLRRLRDGSASEAVGAPRGTALPALLAAAVSAIALFQLGARAARQGGLAEALATPPPQEQVELAAWAEKETGIADTFLVDPDWKLFRALAKRPVFVTIKDGSAILWDRSFAGTWLERLHALGIDTGAGRKDWWEFDSTALYARLDEDDVTDLSARYRIDYWIVPAGMKHTFPVAYRGGSFSVLRTPRTNVPVSSKPLEAVR